jgi:chemotaxis protein CheX
MELRAPDRRPSPRKRSDASPAIECGRYERVRLVESVRFARANEFVCTLVRFGVARLRVAGCLRLRRGGVMAKPSSKPQQRTRNSSAAKKSSPARKAAKKTVSAKGQYYPKVDLSDLEDRLLSSWSQASVVAPAEAPPAPSPTAHASRVEWLVVEAVSASEEEKVMSPPVAIFKPASAAAPKPNPTPLRPASSASPAPMSARETLRLPSCLDLPAARPLANSLIERRGRPIVIDASAVSQVGAQCIQVLLSAKRSWETDGVPLSIVNCSSRAIDDLRLLGIDSTTLVTGELPQ